MSGRKAGEKSSPENLKPKRKKCRVKSKQDNGGNVYRFDGVSTGQLSSGIDMATQKSSMSGVPSMPGQFL